MPNVDEKHFFLEVLRKLSSTSLVFSAFGHRNVDIVRSSSETPGDNVDENSDFP